jgi:hypothetical protein
MRGLRLIPVVLCFLVLGAHSSRAGWPLAVTVVLAALPLLLLTGRPWAPRLLQVALLLGALEWIRTIFTHVESRRAQGLPYQRMVLILGAVALATAASSLALRGWSRRRRRIEANA